MKIGITGHQERDGIDWGWVRQHIRQILSVKSELNGYSCLASGTDQIFAEILLEEGGHLIAVIPIENYASYFENAALDKYISLLARSQVIDLDSTRLDEQAFLDAGKWIVRNVDQIIAVWDGKEADGTGGTGDIVSYAISLNKPIIHLNPISRKIYNL